MTLNKKLEDVLARPFGSFICEEMMYSNFEKDRWSLFGPMAVDQFKLHPAAHVLSYASTCFEGLKAFRGNDNKIRLFRVDAHAARMRRSSKRLLLPFPGEDALKDAISQLVSRLADWVPTIPNAFYIRPTLIGTNVTIGSAASPAANAMLYIMGAPVGDYLGAGDRTINVVLDDCNGRAVPGFGEVKSGANYAPPLGVIVAAKNEHHASQVVFAPDGIVQESGAANFLLIDDNRIITKDLDGNFLPGITRDSILKLGQHLGYQIEERPITVEEVLNWIGKGEAVLSGTAAVLTSIGSIVYNGKKYPVANGKTGTNAKKLRQALIDIQTAKSEDVFQWLTPVTS